MKKITKLLIAVLLCISFSKVDAINVSPTPGVFVGEKNYFIKTDDKNNGIEDAEFTQVTINGQVMLDSIKEKILTPEVAPKQKMVPTIKEGATTTTPIEGLYEYVYFIEDTNNALDLLTPDQKEIVDKFKTLSDYEAIRSKVNNKIASQMHCEGKTLYINFLKDSKGIEVKEYFNEGAGTAKNFIKNNVMRLQSSDIGEESKISGLLLHAITYTFIEETKTPKGLEKSFIIVPMEVSIYYTVNPDNTLTLDYAKAYQNKVLMMYDPNIDYTDIADVYAKMDNSKMFQLLTTCDFKSEWENYFCEADSALQSANTESKVPTRFFTDVKGSNCHAIVIDKTSTEDLSKKVEIKSFVNGKKEVNVQKSEEVTIQVKVYNGSKTPLYTNKVVSKVPQDFTLVDGSILKNGIYDENTRTVTWNHDYLDSMDSEIFSYKVKAPDTIKDGTSVKTSATLTTNDSTVPIVSDEATMDLGDQKTNDNITNPNTGILTEQIVSVVLSVSVLLVLLFVRKNRIQSI